MRRETCNRTRRFGMLADTCGTRLRNKSSLWERRIEESDDEETMEDGARSGWSSDGTCRWLGFRPNEKRIVWFLQCSEHWTRDGARVGARREVRGRQLSVLHTRAC